MRRELNRDGEEEARSYGCLTDLERERREIFIDRWQKISAEERFERGRLCPDAQLWLSEWGPRIDEYVPSTLTALNKLKDDLLQLVANKAADTGPRASEASESWQTEAKPAAAAAPTTPGWQHDAHSRGGADAESGTPLTPMTALKRRTEAYLAGLVETLQASNAFRVRS